MLTNKGLKNDCECNSWYRRDLNRKIHIAYLTIIPVLKRLQIKFRIFDSISLSERSFLSHSHTK